MNKKIIFEKLKKISISKFENIDLLNNISFKGFANIDIKVLNNKIFFKENGSIISSKNKKYLFSNNICWALNDDNLFLYRIINQKNYQLISKFNDDLQGKHLCGKDTYISFISINKNNIELFWEISGYNKNEKVKIIYT